MEINYRNAPHTLKQKIKHGLPLIIFYYNFCLYSAYPPKIMPLKRTEMALKSIDKKIENSDK